MRNSLWMRTTWPSERFHVLDKILFFLRRQVEMQEHLVVRDHIRVGGKAAVVVEATLLPYEEPFERCRPVELLVGRAAGLEVVDPHLGGGVHGPAGLGEKRRHVTAGALRLAVEYGLAAARPRRVERACLGLGGGDRQLVEMQSRQLRR